MSGNMPLPECLRRQQQPRPTPHGVLALSNRRGTSSSASSAKDRARRNRCIVAMVAILVAVGYFDFILDGVDGGVGAGWTTRQEDGREDAVDAPTQKADEPAAKSATRQTADASTIIKQGAPGRSDQADVDAFDRCSFRSYPSHRYYGINAPLKSQPPFLSGAKYIRGELPFALNPPENDGKKKGGNSTPNKICVDTSEWEDVQSGRFPFSDGQNPSVVSLALNPYGESEEGAKNGASSRLNAAAVAHLAEVYGASELEGMYLGVLVVGHAQCRWRMSPEEFAVYHYSDLEEAPDRRTIITILDRDMRTVGQSILLIEHDAPWGKNRRKGKAIPDKSGNGFERSVQYLDDPRIFFHDGEPYVLYRQGGRFGYEDQVQNPLHFETRKSEKGETTIVAYVKASETFTVCCGRNIALISERGKDNKSALKALTWVDPVTVVDVDMGNSKASQAGAAVGRRLLEDGTQSGRAPPTLPSDHSRDTSRRRLAGRRQKSEIHGTNGYMVPLHSTSELLGIAHFHRPEDRKPSDYALHGHHYTHALFTIAKRKNDGGDNNNQGEYRLKRISNEFVFRSMSPSLSKADPPVVDAETIQFASGLDLIGSDKDGRLLLSYGINDCEGGALFLDMEAVQSLLQDVPDGKEVFDLMAPAKL